MPHMINYTLKCMYPFQGTVPSTENPSTLHLGSAIGIGLSVTSLDASQVVYAFDWLECGQGKERTFSLL